MRINSTPDSKPARTRSLSPTKAGRIFGKFTPSHVGHIEMKEGGVIRTIPANRELRRKLRKEGRNP